MYVLLFGEYTLNESGLSTFKVLVFMPIVPCSWIKILEFTIGSNPPLNIITLLLALALPMYKSLAEEYK